MDLKLQVCNIHGQGVRGFGQIREIVYGQGIYFVILGKSQLNLGKLDNYLKEFEPHSKKFRKTAKHLYFYLFQNI